MSVKMHFLAFIFLLVGLNLARADSSEESNESQGSVKCPLGSVRTFNKLSCFTCGPGYFNDNSKRRCNSSTSSNIACCKVCPNGHSCPGSGTKKPILCLAGTAANINKDQCVDCSIGYYAANNASQCSTSSCCSKCPAGHICPTTGISKPTKCLAGTAANFDATECIANPNGYYMLTDGAQCQSSANSDSDCFTRCPSGHKCSNPTTSSRKKRSIVNCRINV